MAEGLINFISEQSFNLDSKGGGSSASPFTVARVYDIVLDESHPRFDEVGQWNGIGTIFYQTTDAMTNASSSESPAKPVFTNQKNYPLINEVVYLFSLPSPSSQTSGQDKILYYFSPVNIWNSQHHNALPNILLSPDNQQPDYEETEAGVVRRVTDGSTEIELGKTFVEKTNINPLLPFEGDVIQEGRWGNSIRFGSTVSGKTNWSETGENGNPITIIRNGEDPNNGDEGWVPVVEDINNDLSSIWMTSTQQIPLEAASSLNNSYSTSPDTLDQYAGSQIIINSDRVVLNSKTDHIILSSAKSVSLSALESVNIDTKEHIIDANSIKLGSKDATESLMLGDKTVDLLGNILDELSSVMGQLSGLVSLPPGAPFVPLNAQAIQSQLKLNLYKNQLKTLLSKQNKTV